MKLSSIGMAASLSVIILFGGIATPSIAKSKKTISKQAIEEAIAHQEKGNKLDDEGDLNGAIAEYNQSLHFNPDDPNTLFNLGVVYMKANNSPEAVKVFEKLSKLLPEDSEVCNLMGVALSGAGKKLEAIKSWEKSLSLQPDQEKVKEMIAELKKTCAEEETK